VRVDIRGETQMLEGPDDEADYAEGEWVENAAGEMEFHAADGSVISADAFNEPAGDAGVTGDAVETGDAVDAVVDSAAEAPAEATNDTAATAEEGGDEPAS
jgi:hypothetical protein